MALRLSMPKMVCDLKTNFDFEGFDQVPIVVVTMGDEILGHKDLFSFHKKDIVADSSLAPHAKSFADVVLNTKTMVMSLPSTSSIPQQKGAYVSVKVNPTAVEERLNLCKFSLIRRVILSKGDKPWSLLDLKARIDLVWKISSWHLISLRKGYFLILLISEEDKTHVWSMSSLNIKPGILKLQPWVPGFVPSEQKTTNVQVCVRFYELSWEFWHSQILSDLARAVGVPLKIDQATLNGDFGHFA
ncbi:hypothetical protein PanWU01x14_087640 [Parasponia andersonii]|uniref:DUF4283 domain-containing protein n=1 Tax=Parasponia andersonii TaxID=3476 RepID=A0A2P5D8L1_PARAD|nr:hypothetical protein PanWU01x14_087640 [Parasponia andersonii]